MYIIIIYILIPGNMIILPPKENNHNPKQKNICKANITESFISFRIWNSFI